MKNVLKIYNISAYISANELYIIHPTFLGLNYWFILF